MSLLLKIVLKGLLYRTLGTNMPNAVYVQFSLIMKSLSVVGHYIPVFNTECISVHFGFGVVGFPTPPTTVIQTANRKDRRGTH